MGKGTAGLFPLRLHLEESQWWYQRQGKSKERKLEGSQEMKKTHHRLAVVHWKIKARHKDSSWIAVIKTDNQFGDFSSENNDSLILKL